MRQQISKELLRLADKLVKGALNQGLMQTLGALVKQHGFDTVQQHLVMFNQPLPPKGEVAQLTDKGFGPVDSHQASVAAALVRLAEALTVGFGYDDHLLDKIQDLVGWYGPNTVQRHLDKAIKDPTIAPPLKRRQRRRSV